MALPKTKAQFIDPLKIRAELLALTPDNEEQNLETFGQADFLLGLEGEQKQKCANYHHALLLVGSAALQHTNQFNREFDLAFPVTRRLIDILTPDNYGDIINEFVGYMDFHVPFMQKQYSPHPTIDWEAECMVIFCDLQKKIFPV